MPGKVLSAARSGQLITFDGTPEPFVTLNTLTGRWVAVRRHDDLCIRTTLYWAGNTDLSGDEQVTQALLSRPCFALVQGALALGQAPGLGRR